MRTRQRLRSVLANWRTLIADINTLDEAEARWCLDTEIAGECRKVFVERLYGRYSRARADRERLELAKAQLAHRQSGD